MIIRLTDSLNFMKVFEYRYKNLYANNFHTVIRIAAFSSFTRNIAALSLSDWTLSNL